MPNVEITVITEAAEKPVTLLEAKAWLRVTHSEDDAMITELIASATNNIEAYISNPIITKKFLYKNDKSLVNHNNEEYLCTPYQPTSIEFVKIYNGLNVATTLSTTHQYGSKILLGYHGVTPRNNQAYQVQFEAGIASNASSVPQEIKIIIKEIIALYYDGSCSDKDIAHVLSTLSGYRNFNEIALQ